jgi:hypothetical protein
MIQITIHTITLKCTFTTPRCIRRTIFDRRSSYVHRYYSSLICSVLILSILAYVLQPSQIDMTSVRTRKLTHLELIHNLLYLSTRHQSTVSYTVLVYSSIYSSPEPVELKFATVVCVCTSVLSMQKTMATLTQRASTLPTSIESSKMIV